MKGLLYISFLILSLGLHSQELSATLNHSQIVVGEQVELTLKVKLPKRTNLRFEPYQGFIPGKLQNANSALTTTQKVELEIIEEFSDTLIEGKKEDVWKGKYLITCWDSGTVVLPEAMIVIDDSTYYFESLRLNCGLVKAVKNQDIYDIKESFADVPEPETALDKIVSFTKENYYWIFPLLAILVFIIIQLKRHKRAAKPVRKVQEISLKDKTILAIESLEKRKLWETGQLKLHYTELSYIMRAYLSARYELNLLEKTTIETRLLLRQAGLHNETIDTLIIILNHSDMVKFAKSEPDEISILKVSILAKQIVAETSPIEFEGAE